MRVGPASTTILVADDNRVLRSVVLEMLRQSGYHVLEADDGAEAQRIIANGSQVDLLLTDLWMPVMNGLELASWLRDHRPAMRIVVMTGSLHELNHVIQRTGPIPLLVKPFTGGQLVGAIRAVLNGKASQRARKSTLPAAGAPSVLPSDEELTSLRLRTSLAAPARPTLRSSPRLDLGTVQAAPA